MKMIESKVVSEGLPVWDTYHPDGYIHAVGRDNDGVKTDYNKLSKEERAGIPKEAKHFCDLIAQVF